MNVERCPHCNRSMFLTTYFSEEDGNSHPVMYCRGCDYRYFMLKISFPCLPEAILYRWNEAANTEKLRLKKR